jgi:hypothetical protein
MIDEINTTYDPDYNFDEANDKYVEMLKEAVATLLELELQEYYHKVSGDPALMLSVDMRAIIDNDVIPMITKDVQTLVMGCEPDEDDDDLDCGSILLCARNVP